MGGLRQAALWGPGASLESTWHATRIGSPFRIRRLLSLEDGCVTFCWKDYAANNQTKVMKLDAVEFIRRFLLHILPTGFVRIRQFGFLANRARGKKLALCRTLLGAASMQRLNWNPTPTPR